LNPFPAAEKFGSPHGIIRHFPTPDFSTINCLFFFISFVFSKTDSLALFFRV